MDSRWRRGLTKVKHTHKLNADMDLTIGDYPIMQLSQYQISLSGNHETSPCVSPVNLLNNFNIARVSLQKELLLSSCVQSEISNQTHSNYITSGGNHQLCSYSIEGPEISSRH